MANAEFKYKPIIQEAALLGSFNRDFAVATVCMAVNEHVFEPISSRICSMIESRIKAVMEAYARRPVTVEIEYLSQSELKCCIEASGYYPLFLDIAI